MKILMSIDSLGGGGAEKVVLNLCRALVGMGHLVTILSIRKDVEHLVDFPVKIETLNFSKKLLADVRFSRALKKKIIQMELEQGKFDLIVSHLNLSNKLFQKAGIPDAFFCLHSVLSTANLGRRRGLRKLFKLWKLHSLLNGKDIVTVSKGIVDDMVEQIGIKARSIHTIYNAVDFSHIKSLSGHTNPFGGQEYIVHVGRFTREKRHDRLIEAYRRSGIKEKLVLVGDGPLRPEMESLVAQCDMVERVEFTGFLPNPYPLIKEAKLLVLSSDFEGLPTVLLEALSLNTPVASTDCPTGPNEILTGAARRYLCPTSSTEKLSENIVQALSDYALGNYPFSDIDLSRFEPDFVANQYLLLASYLQR